MSENWNNMMRCSSREDYALLPTSEPSAETTNARPSERQNRPSAAKAENYGKLRASFKRGSTAVQPADDRLESQLPLTDEQPTGHHSSHARPKVDTESRGSGSVILVDNPTSCWRFVEHSWFQAISAVVIITNVITTIVEMDKPETKKMFFISDQVMLCFYVVELFSRASFFGMIYLFGPRAFVCWNVLDIIVVGAGVVDQWMMPLLPVGDHSGIVSKILNLLRLLRLLRVFKIVRVFLEIDLSWTEAPAFQSFIGIVILINSLLMGMEIDIPWGGWFYFEQILLCIYVFELSVRLKNFGKFFFSCDNADIVWNTLDFAIVSSSVLDSWLTPLCKIVSKSLVGAQKDVKKQSGMSLGKVMMLMRMLRLMRILRLAKLVKSVRPLFILVTGVMAALQGVAWVLVLTIVTLYAMGILATSLIGKKMAFPPGSDVPQEILKPFSTVPNSMFTLFRVMSGAASDAEQVAIDDLMDNCPSIKLGFVFFMITSSWTLLSILTAVVSDNMISTTGQQEEEHKLETAEQDRSEHLEGLREIFAAVDTSGDGRAEKKDIEDFLSDHDNAKETARRCRVPVRDVKEVLQTVADSCEGTTVSLETFVEYLADVSSVVTEKSVMKMETRLTNLSRYQVEGFVKLDKILEILEVQENSGNNVFSKLESAAEVCSKALQNNAVVMQNLAEKTEARLSEIQLKNQDLFDNMNEALNRQLCRMRQELLGSMSRQESGSSNVHDVQESDISNQVARATINLMTDQGSTSKRHPGRGIRTSLILATKDIEEWPATGETEKQPVPAEKNDEDVADKVSGAQVETGAVQMEARLLAAEESIHGLQQATKTMLAESSATPGVSSVAFDKFSESLESELRRMRQELLFCLGRHGPEIYKARDTTEGDKQLARECSGPLVETLARECSGPLVETQVEKAGGQMEVLAAQMGAQLLANERSIHALQQKTEALLRNLEVLVEKAVCQALPPVALDKFSETGGT